MNDRKRYRVGMSAYNAGRYADAIEHLMPLASGRTGAQALLGRFYLGQAHYRLAVQLFEQRRFADASLHFESAARVNPSGGGFARFLAVCHLGTGQMELAAHDFAAMLREDPSDARVRIRLALTQHGLGQPVEAVATLREGLRLDPGNAEYYYQLGVMEAAADDLEEAQKLFEKALMLDPSHGGAYERLAQCFGVAERPEAALDYLQRAGELDPCNARVALQISILAQAVDKSGGKVAVDFSPMVLPNRLDDGDIDRLGEAIATEPDFVEAFLSLPVSEVDEEVFSVLATTLERALEKHPEFADLHYHCSKVYRRLGADARAIEHAERAVEINPRYVEALVLLARLYGQTNQWATAVGRLERAIQLGVDYPDIHYLIGQLYQQGNRPDYARQAYQRALDLNSEYAAAQEALKALAV